MTFTQIKYFIEVARCLNFTEAAARLFVTQPTLSRQITAIESELNMQLFIRNNKTLRLTPGGTVLFEELTLLMENYENIVEKAREASHGLIGNISIGVIDGLDIGDILPDLVEHLETGYPNIRIHLLRASFSDLIDQLYDCRLDAIITYDFDIRLRPGIQYKNIQQLRPVLAIPRRHPLAVKKNVTLKDFEQESLVIVSAQESPSGVELVQKTCQEFGGYYPNFYFVDTMETDAILWVEAGLKCALLNDGMTIVKSDAIKVVPLDELPSMNAVLAAGYPQNNNFALPILLDYFKTQRK